MMIKVANKIRELLEEKDMTQGELARQAELPEAHLNRIINEETMPQVDTAYRIVFALGLPFESVFPAKRVAA